MATEVANNETMTFAAAAEKVLTDAGRAMTVDELWGEIERRRLVRTRGKTPKATLQVELSRKAPNTGYGDDETPTFYRQEDGTFGRWSDLSRDRQTKMLDAARAASPTAFWRDLYEDVKADPAWRERIDDMIAVRAKAGAEIAQLIGKCLSGSMPLEDMRIEFDRRSRTDWESFRFGGNSFAMNLNMLAKASKTNAGFESILRTSLAVPRDEHAARQTLLAFANALTKLREQTENKRALPHPNRIPKLFSALWHAQNPNAWPVYYGSARDALDETGLATPSDDPIESYLTFRTMYLKLVSELGTSMVEFEQLCKLQQEADDDEEITSASTWLFQSRPETFDLRGAVEHQKDISWRTPKHRKRIREGDRVYLWEAGDDAALIAVGTITSDPDLAVPEPTLMPYYRDASDAVEEHRVGVRIDRVIHPPLGRRRILAEPALSRVGLFRHAQGTNFELSAAVVSSLEALLARPPEAPARSYWKIAPGENAEAWPEMQKDGVIAVSWHGYRLGDLRNYASKEGLLERFAALHPDVSERKRKAAADQLWAFREIRVGDTIVANKGFSKVVGEGTVTGEYFHRPDHHYLHALPVRWARTDERQIEDQGGRWRPTVVVLSADEYDALFDDDDDAETERRRMQVATDAAAQPYSIEDALKRVFMSKAELGRLVDLLRYKKNLVLQGPPGVGKTFVAAELAYLLLGAIDEDRIKRVQFHQSYAYEDFVRGYRPAMGGGFEYRDGPMLEFCSRAHKDPRPHVMIIDEINRGNLSKILGELMLLIEPDKRDKRWAVDLAYSKAGELPFWVPDNLYVIGTMNTADRSLALVDYALRRRFAFAWVLPAFGLGGFEEYLQGINVPAALRTKLVTKVTDLNRVIEQDTRNLGRGYVIGHSYFCQKEPPGGFDDGWYERIVRFEIEPLLEEYFAEDPDKVKSLVEGLLS